METRDDLSTTCQDADSAWCYIPTSLPQEHAAKTDMLSVVSIQVISIVYSWGGYN